MWLGAGRMSRAALAAGALLFCGACGAPKSPAAGSLGAGSLGVGSTTASAVATPTPSPSSAVDDTRSVVTADAPPASAQASAQTSAQTSGAPEPFEEDGRWGYRSADGRVVIPPDFALAEPFSEHGIAAVADDTGPMIIDARGRVLLRPFVFDNGPDYFAEGLARFVDKGKIGYFDEAGRVVIGAAFDFGEPFEGGHAAVCSGCTRAYLGEHYRMVGGSWWQIDRRGQKVKGLPAPAP